MELSVATTEILDDSILSIFPNPVESTMHFSMQTQGVQNVQVKLFDILGRVVLQEEFQSDQNELNQQIDLDFLQSGTYVFEASTSESSVYKKISVY